MLIRDAVLMVLIVWFAMCACVCLWSTALVAGVFCVILNMFGVVLLLRRELLLIVMSSG